MSAASNGRRLSATGGFDIRVVAPAWTEDLPIFASGDYLSSVATESGWLGGFTDERLRLGLPFVRGRKIAFSYAQFQTAVLDLGEAPDHGAEQAFLEAATRFLGREGVQLIVVPPTHALFDACPKGSICAPFGSYVVDLSPPEDALWGAVHPKHRNVIRKAQAEGVLIERGPDAADLCWEMLSETMGRSRMAFMGRDAFVRLVDGLGEHIELFVAKKEGALQACAAIPFSRHAAYYLYGGSAPEPSLGSSNLLHWEAMRHFKSLGVRRYDFVGARLSVEQGTKLEGIQRFKSRFGGELVKGYLFKTPLSRPAYAAYRLLRTLRDGPGGDIIDQELRSRKGPR